LPVIGWSVWCFRNQKKQSENHFSMAVRDGMRSLNHRCVFQ
jgi:hypothetical protein